MQINKMICLSMIVSRRDDTEGTKDKREVGESEGTGVSMATADEIPTCMTMSIKPITMQ